MSNKYVKLFRKSEKLAEGIYASPKVKWEIKINSGVFLMFWGLAVIGVAFELSKLCDANGGGNTTTGVLLGFLTLMSALGGVSMFVGGIVQSLQNKY